MKKVCVGVILYGEKYLSQSITSLLNQDYQNVEYVFLDQEENFHSAYYWLKKNLPDAFKKAKIIKANNKWHSGGHNLIINQTDADYYLCASNDMLYPKDMITKMINVLEKNLNVGFVGAKLLRWDFAGNKKTDIIDSSGINITKSFGFFEFESGKKYSSDIKTLINTSNHLRTNEVFGISAALCMYKIECLQKIKFNNQFFDEFLHYKNDIDLSYRLRVSGVNAKIVNDLIVYHDRQVKSFYKMPFWARKSSFRGDLLILSKYFSKKFPLQIKIQILTRYFFKTFFLLCLFPNLWKEFLFLSQNFPLIKKFRKKFPQNDESVKKILSLMKNLKT